MPDSAINFYAYWPLIGSISSNQEVPDIVTGRLDLDESAILSTPIRSWIIEMDILNGISKFYGMSI